jgi:hypothetical protein
MIDFLLDIGLFVCLLGICALTVIVFDEVIGWLTK